MSQRSCNRPTRAGTSSCPRVTSISVSLSFYARINAPYSLRLSAALGRGLRQTTYYDRFLPFPFSEIVAFLDTVADVLYCSAFPTHPRSAPSS